MYLYVTLPYLTVNSSQVNKYLLLQYWGKERRHENARLRLLGSLRKLGPSNKKQESPAVPLIWQSAPHIERSNLYPSARPLFLR